MASTPTREPRDPESEEEYPLRIMDSSYEVIGLVGQCSYCGVWQLMQPDTPGCQACGGPV